MSFIRKTSHATVNTRYAVVMLLQKHEQEIKFDGIIIVVNLRYSNCVYHEMFIIILISLSEKGIFYLKMKESCLHVIYL